MSSGSYVVVVDRIVDTVTSEEVVIDEYENVLGDMFNSAPSRELKKKVGESTHIVRTKIGYDIYFHLEIG